jgi:hypothetical protein
MKFVYDSSFNAMLKALFEDSADQHGWTYEEFQEALLNQAIAVAEGKLQTWVH